MSTPIAKLGPELFFVIKTEGCTILACKGLGSLKQEWIKVNHSNASSKSNLC